MAHTASVSISRFFDRSRGKALSYVWVGMSFGEFFFTNNNSVLFNVYTLEKFMARIRYYNYIIVTNIYLYYN